jgi:hypothetical protein
MGGASWAKVPRQRTLRSLGYLPEICLLPDPGQPLLVARVSWQRRAACTEFEQQLFGQVRQRRTHRGGFDLVPLPPGLSVLPVRRSPLRGHPA